MRLILLKNEKTFPFLATLCQGAGLPSCVVQSDQYPTLRQRAWHVINKMVRNNDFDIGSQETLYPTTLQVVTESAKAQYSIYEEPPHAIEVLISSLTFINHHFPSLKYETEQRGLVQLVFQGIPRWQQLILEHHPLGSPFFQAVCKLFKSVLKEWAPKVYTTNDFSKIKHFAYEKALHKASLMIPPPNGHPNHLYKDSLMNMYKGHSWSSDEENSDEQLRNMGMNSKTKHSNLAKPPQELT